jgi:hypothetical protein
MLVLSNEKIDSSNFSDTISLHTSNANWPSRESSSSALSRIYPSIGEVNAEAVKAVIIPDQEAVAVLVYCEILEAVGSSTNDILKVLGLCVKVDLPDDGDVRGECGTY